MNKEITVEQGYYVSLTFFNLLYQEIKSNIKKNEEIKEVHDLFIHGICTGEDACDELKQVVSKTMEISIE